MTVTCVYIQGENVIIPTSQYNHLYKQAEKVAKLEKVIEAAAAVMKWDWSDCDDECIADIDRLNSALDALSPKY